MSLSPGDFADAVVDAERGDLRGVSVSVVDVETVAGLDSSRGGLLPAVEGADRAGANWRGETTHDGLGRGRSQLREGELQSFEHLMDGVERNLTMKN